MLKAGTILVTSFLILVTACSIRDPHEPPPPKPGISNVIVNPASVRPGLTATVVVDVSGGEPSEFEYSYYPECGVLDNYGHISTYTAPSDTGVCDLWVYLDHSSTRIDTFVVHIPVRNEFPIIELFEVVPNNVIAGGVAEIHISATDANDDALSYTFDPSEGSIFENDGSFYWTVPSRAGTFSISVSVEDGFGGYANDTASITVFDNSAPDISSISVSPNPIRAGCEVDLSASASDPDGDQITYTWSTPSGTLTGPSPSFTAPSTQGPYTITLEVRDSRGASSEDSRTLNIWTYLDASYISPLSGNTGGGTAFSDPSSNVVGEMVMVGMQISTGGLGELTLRPIYRRINCDFTLGSRIYGDYCGPGVGSTSTYEPSGYALTGMTVHWIDNTSGDPWMVTGVELHAAQWSSGNGIYGATVHSDLYGSTYGDAHIDYKGMSGGVLLGIRGRSGARMDALGVVAGKHPAD